MKNLFIAIFLLFTFSSQAQTWGAKLENAQFQIRINNHSAYTSEVKKVQGLFSENDFQLISDRCLSKEGVFKIDISQDKSTLIVYYLDWIDQWTINWLFTEANPELNYKLRIHPKVVFNF